MGMGWLRIARLILKLVSARHARDLGSGSRLGLLLLATCGIMQVCYSSLGSPSVHTVTNRVSLASRLLLTCWFVINGRANWHTGMELLYGVYRSSVRPAFHWRQEDQEE